MHVLSVRVGSAGFAIVRAFLRALKQAEPLRCTTSKSTGAVAIGGSNLVGLVELIGSYAGLTLIEPAAANESKLKHTLMFCC